MTYFEADFGQQQPDDLVESIIAALEEDYNCEVQRVARMNQLSKFHFTVSLIFTDYRLLEAEIKVITKYGLPALEICGVYY